MKRILFPLGAVLALAMADVRALTPQQEKMKTCNAEASSKSLKGDDRKAFMKKCLAAAKPGRSAKPVLTPQQERMKTCNADASARGLKGSERKDFLKGCLAKGAAPAQ